MALVTYIGRATRIRIPGGQELRRGEPTELGDGLSAWCEAQGGFEVIHSAPPAPLSAPRSRRAASVAAEPTAAPEGGDDQAAATETAESTSTDSTEGES